MFYLLGRLRVPVVVFLATMSFSQVLFPSSVAADTSATATSDMSQATTEGLAWESPVVVNVSDSYGAGNGTRNYFEESCFTSPENFAQIVARQIGGSVAYDASCGGATSVELRDGSPKIPGVNHDPEIERLGKDVDLVFTSMGGNDAKFSSIVVHCIIGLIPTKCDDRLTDAHNMLNDGTLIRSVEDTLRAIEYKMRNARIVLVGYPNLHADHPVIRDLLAAYTAQQRKLINELAVEQPNKWVFVDRRELFAGHEIGSSDEWLWDWTAPLSTDVEVPDDLYHPKPIGWQATAGLIAAHPLVGSMGLFEKAKGGIVRDEDSIESWLVDDNGVRHPLLDGGAFECAYAQNGQRLIVTKKSLIESVFPTVGDPAKPVCEQIQVGDVLVDQANRSWLTDPNGTGEHVRVEIGSESAFRCATNLLGRTVRRNILTDDLNKFRKNGGLFYCLDPNEFGNKVLVNTNTNESFLAVPFAEEQLVLKRITDTESFHCHEQRTRTDAIRHLNPAEIMDAWNVQVHGTAERCLDWQNYTGKILEADARQVLVTAFGQRGVRDGRTSRCLTEWNNTPVDHLDTELLESVPVDPAGWASCKTGVADGTIVRNHDTGWSGRKYTGTDGVEFLAHIETSETFRCLEGNGVPRIDVPTAKIEAFLVGQTTEVECVTPATFAGMIVRSTDGTSTYYVDQTSHTLRPIRSGGTYLCLNLWAGKPIHPEKLNSDQLAQFKSGSDATCNAHVSATKGMMVRASDGGHVIYVDENGQAHNIRSENAYWCLKDRGVAVMSVPNHEWQQAFAYGTDQAGCYRILKGDTGASYLNPPDDRIVWLPDTQTYWYWADRIDNRNIVAVAQTTIDAMGVDGNAKRRLSMTRYEGKIVRDANGRAGIVLGGVWRHIPDGHSWSCYTGRGYPIGEYSVHPDNITNSPQGSRLNYCLNPASYKETMIRRSDGTVYKTDGNACRRHVGNGWTYEALRERGYSVTANNLNQEHTSSLSYCGTHQYMFSKQSFKHTLIRRKSTGAVFFVNSKGCRYHVRDGYTLERRVEQGYKKKHWSASNSEITSLPYCGKHPYMLAKHRVANHVVRGPDGTSWMVKGGEWFWIKDGSLWNHLVNRYGLAPGTYNYTWQHIDSIKYDRGRWAWYWM